MKMTKQERLLQMEQWFKNIVIPEIKKTEKFFNHEKNHIEEKKEG